MNAGPAHAPARRDPYSFSLKKIIQDVEARTGRKFSGPELDAPHHAEPRYPRQTRQTSLEGGVPPAASPSHFDTTKGAGRAAPGRPARQRTGPASGRGEDIPTVPALLPQPGGCDIGHVSTVLSLLPQIPRLGDEAFLFLYLNISADFERRFGIQGWYDRVLTMAAQGRK